ncbi:hypothetical protein TSUD_330740 [Trifolium subterraneum]|nr:hypothetical protein TSUD_330740 [Trifolium subterraneum]
MSSWMKNKGYNQYPKVGQWQSPPFNGRPPLPKPPVAERFSPVPQWEKKFCYSVGSVPWRKVIEVKKCMLMHPIVGRNQREQYGGGLHNKYQGRNGGSGNRGRNGGSANQGTWDGYKRKKENNRENNMSWSKNPLYHHSTNDYQMKKPGYNHGANDYQTNGGRKGNGGRGGGGGRRGNFGYVEKVAPSGRW